MVPEIELLKGLTEAQRNYVLMKAASKKDTAIAYLCWFLVGVHYFYLGKPIINILYWITGGGFLIWMLIDLFRIPGMVRGYNYKKLEEAIAEAKELYPSEHIAIES